MIPMCDWRYMAFLSEFLADFAKYSLFCRPAPLRKQGPIARGVLFAWKCESCFCRDAGGMAMNEDAPRGDPAAARLDQLQPAQAGMAVPRHDDVVMHGDAQLLCCFHDALGHVDICT